MYVKIRIKFCSLFFVFWVFIFWSHLMACRILVSQPGIKLVPPAVKVQCQPLDCQGNPQQHVLRVLILAYRFRFPAYSQGIPPSFPVIWPFTRLLYTQWACFIIRHKQWRNLCQETVSFFSWKFAINYGGEAGKRLHLTPCKSSEINMLLLLLSRFSRVRLCATP